MGLVLRKNLKTKMRKKRAKTKQQAKQLRSMRALSEIRLMISDLEWETGTLVVDACKDVLDQVLFEYTEHKNLARTNKELQVIHHLLENEIFRKMSQNEQ